MTRQCPDQLIADLLPPPPSQPNRHGIVPHSFPLDIAVSNTSRRRCSVSKVVSRSEFTEQSFTPESEQNFQLYA